LKSGFLAWPLQRVYLTNRLPGFFDTSKLLKQTVGIINLEVEIVGLRQRLLQGSAEGRIRSESGQIAISNLWTASKAMRARLLAGTFPTLPSCPGGRNGSGRR
jgi:hypothetical protein